MLSSNLQEGQLSQLRRHAPDIYERVMSRPDDLPAAVAEGMKELLVRLTNDVERLWGQVVAQIEDAKSLPIISGAQKDVAVFRGKNISLFLRADGKLALYDGLGTTSQPVALYGRDWAKQSSAYAGMWKLTENARANFEQWVARSGAPAQTGKFRKVGGQWLSK